MNNATAMGLFSLLVLSSGAGCGSVAGEPTGATENAVRSCAHGATVEGIDVSTYEGLVDWDAVKASGKAFAFARVSDGLNHVDETFDRNWTAIQSHGLIRGAYQFLRVGQDPIAQADLMIAKVGQLGPGDLPPVLDVEVADGYGSDAVVSAIGVWLDRVQSATKRRPIIYTAQYFWNTLNSTAQFATSPLWVANYGVQCPSLPDSWNDWQFWQYSETGSVPGISGSVDVSVFNGSLAALRSLAQAAALPAEAIEVYWARQADGHYDLRALAAADVTRVEYRVDGNAVGGAARAEGDNFPTAYTFTTEGLGRQFEVRGYDSNDRFIARGVGLLDVTAGTAVYVKEMATGLYEIGLERAPSEVAAIEVQVDGAQLVDGVSGTTRSSRLAVRSKLLAAGARHFNVTTFNRDGSTRGTLTRTFTLP